MVSLMGLASLAVDWGYVQLTKSEMQRQADATARGYIALYNTYGQTTANTTGPSLYTNSWNPVDDSSGILTSVAVTWGYWNTGTGQFVSGTNSSYPMAIKIVVSRKASSSNGLNMPLARMIGWGTMDLTCTAIAAVSSSGSATVTGSTSGTSDIWLSGMSAGSSTYGGDTTSNAPADQISGLTISPGTYITFTGVSGSTGYGSRFSYLTPEGKTNSMATKTAGAENGIADIKAPQYSMIGVFLDDNAPNSSAAPSRRDYSLAGTRDLASFDDIQLKQPFFIGDGQTTGGTTQQFLVPAGATRLFIGSCDVYGFYLNWGSYSYTVNSAAADVALKK